MLLSSYLIFYRFNIDLETSKNFFQLKDEFCIFIAYNEDTDRLLKDTIFYAIKYIIYLKIQIFIEKLNVQFFLVFS